MKRTLAGIFLFAMLVSVFVSASKIQLAKAQGTTIYINRDGSITPSTAPVSTVNNVTYTLNQDIGQMVVERNSVTIDGANHTVFSTLTNYGILLNETSNVTVENMQVMAQLTHVDGSGGNYFALDGIRVYSCFNVSIIGNTFTDGVSALTIVESNGTVVSDNNIFINKTAVLPDTSQWDGINLEYSSDNIISGNNLTNCGLGICLFSSSGNSIYHNNFIDNTEQVNSNNSTNTWDNDYPSGGNYWIDYQARYPNAREIDNSNIWNTPYGIDTNNTDNYPLVKPYTGPAETVYIYGDGSVYPSSAPISSVDNVTYTFNGNIRYPAYYGIVVERSNVVIDGNGYAVLGGYQRGNGLYLTRISNVTVENTQIENFQYGVLLSSSNNSIISRNNFTGNLVGIGLSSSSNNTLSGNNLIATGTGILLNSFSNNNTISGNNATANFAGVSLDSSSSNSIIRNTIASNYGEGVFLWISANNNTVSGNNIIANGWDGLYLDVSANNNTIYHDNFIGNHFQYEEYSYSVGSVWDDGYPSGGNYWSDYNGTDLRSGPYQNVTGSDGIGDTSYGYDHYPLMGTFSDYNVSRDVDVQVVSNSTVSDFQFNGTAIILSVSGENGTTGFCNACVPTNLLNGTLTVFVNGTQVQYGLLPGSNSINSYLYFTYSHSTEQAIIIPEFPDTLVLAMFMIVTLLAAAIYIKKLPKTQAREKKVVRET